MSKTIIANWKANPTTLEEALDLFDFYLSEIYKYPNVQLIVCPPFVYIEELAKKLPASPKLQRGEQTTNGSTVLSSPSKDYKLQTISLGSQDLFWEGSGPYTGEISAEMLTPFNVRYVLVGHSDRRYKIGETDEIINKKIKAAIKADITPILLVGEQKKGDDRTVVIEKQLAVDLGDLTSEQVSRVLITYEPVWAISTQPNAEPDTPENTLKAIKIIDNFITTNYKLQTTNYLYGGSVNQKNVADFLKHPEISGAVIGGASLRKEEFTEILKIVSNL